MLSLFSAMTVSYWRETSQFIGDFFLINKEKQITTIIISKIYNQPNFKLQYTPTVNIYTQYNVQKVQST